MQHKKTAARQMELLRTHCGFFAMHGGFCGGGLSEQLKAGDRIGGAPGENETKNAFGAESGKIPLSK